MGLDNGFVARGLEEKDIPSFVRPADIRRNKEEFEVEIAYYRKCWGVRAVVLGVLHADQNGGEWSVDAEDIPAILKGLYKFLDKRYWEDNADSIWEFEDVIDFTLIQQIINLKWLYSYMKAHPEVTCYFYDSY